MKLADDADDNNDFAAGICRVQYIHSVLFVSNCMDACCC